VADIVATAAVHGRTTAGKQVVRMRSERVAFATCHPFNSALFLTTGRPDGRRSKAYRRLGSVIQIRTGEVQEQLPKEDAIEVMGKVVEKFKAGMFSIELDAGRTVLATMAGRLRRNRIKIMNGDKVSVELSPYDLTKGRITYRHK
jgi:translation initiation factor IF-1